MQTVMRSDAGLAGDLSTPADAAPHTTHDRWPAAAGPAGESPLTTRQMLRPFWLAGALLMMLDGLTTYLALTMHADDGAREGNPIAQWAIDQIGVAGMCAAKVVIGVAMMWRLAATAERGHRYEWMNRDLLLRRKPAWKVRRGAAWALAFSVVLMGVVVGNNVRALIGFSTG